MTATLTPTPAVEQAAPELDLEARMAAVDAAMTVRLQEAGLAVDVNSAHLPGSDVDLADVIRGPITMPAPPVDLYPTPVAALLQRAHRRITDGGWCRDAMRHTDGGLCLVGAIRVEARGDAGLGMRGLNHLLDVIRRQFPDAETVPQFNDSHRDGRMPIRILGEAADHAATRGI